LNCYDLTGHAAILAPVSGDVDRAKRLKRAAKFCEDWISVAPEAAGKWGEEFESTPSRRQAEPTTDYISVERNFTEVCVFARPLAELIAPPTMRHHAETPTTMIADLMLADLRLSHHTLAQQFDGISLR
jgi:hypothetical protein